MHASSPTERALTQAGTSTGTDTGKQAQPQYYIFMLRNEIFSGMLHRRSMQTAHAFSRTVAALATYLFSIFVFFVAICRRIKKKAKAEGKKCHAKTM